MGISFRDINKEVVSLRDVTRSEITFDTDTDTDTGEVTAYYVIVNDYAHQVSE